MANSDRPSGFRPYGPIRRVMSMESGSACYPGDAVSLAADGQVDPSSAGATIFGVCLDYASASGTKVRVSCDPEQVYVIQADETELSAQGLVGNNADIVATAGDSTYKLSRMELDSSTAGSAAAQLTILGLCPAVGNAWGAQVDVFVRINEHQVPGKDAFAGI